LAARRYREALTISVALGDEYTQVALLAGLASAAALQGDGATAGRLWASVEAFQRKIASPCLQEHERRRYESYLAPLKFDPRFRTEIENEAISLAEAARQQLSDKAPLSY
jgi:hypothetical protein